jgi:pyridoxal phosphate enzyme (YggS family)
MGNMVGEDHIERIRQNLNIVNDKITAAAIRVSRCREEIQLVVVSKSQPREVVAAAYMAGVRNFGENYAEQAVPKITFLEEKPGITWHMIGHIQSRKASLVCEYFDFVHSLDSVNLAQRLDRLAKDAGRVIPVLIELNLGSEETKSGWCISENEPVEMILDDIKTVAALKNLSIKGLMTMPPVFDAPDLVRPYFYRLKTLRDELNLKVPDVDWMELSMGTSGDYEVAVEEGATLVRIGQAVLGPRQQTW